MSDRAVDQNVPSRRRTGRGRRAGAAVAAAAVLGAGAYAGHRFLSPPAQDEDVAAAAGRLQEFLDAWAANRPGDAADLTDSPDGARSLLESVMKNTAPVKAVITADRDRASKDGKGAVTVPFKVSLHTAGAGELAYDSRARLVEDGSGTWRVQFSAPVVHPRMEAGQTLALAANTGRGRILDKDGAPLEAASLTGAVDEHGKGVSGLQARYQKELSGGAPYGKSVVIADRRSGAVVTPLTGGPSGKGEDVRTTIDQKVQRAASDALEGLDKNASIVAVDPRTGAVLAAANRPGGMNRALEGRYPPGSTFKVVTAAALLKAGMKPGDPAACPEFASVDGQRFENQNRFVLPEGSLLRDSFAKSCNTFFVEARRKVAGPALPETAKAFGIGGPWDIGAVSYDGSVPLPASDNELAAGTIGQARIQASPLVMASMAATVKEGAFKQPVLVPDHVRNRHTAPALEAHVAEGLREMMRASVTHGAAAALKDVPGTAHAKTGTAEYGEAEPPQTHAWMIGYLGDRDVAWAVLIEDGGSGGKDAGPVAARFLAALR
ncbi:penicillin-binding transpeptidase domain-containing protein [Streptomyces sp. NPDC046866]|uniref:penicillin-binding transpeptidase domain-containing protein n=1 Tax=Streptomyces sp. NPDC046866 TaxID=3154921 RepID=UPI003451F07A